MKSFWKVKMWRGLLITCFAVLAIWALLPQQAKAADTDRYGYSMLATTSQKELYALIVDAVTDFEDEISMDGRKYKDSDLTQAMAMVKRDYPEFFYLSNYSYSVGSDHIVHSLDLMYKIHGKEVKGNNSELRSARAAFEQKVNEIVKGAKGNDYQKALYLHDYVVNNVIYSNTKNDQTAYGALMEGKAVCAGYSHAYQHLLRKAGIESFYITGTSKGASHAWLLVFLNGECYYTDITWDDPVTSDGTQILGHYYFDMSFDEISKDHVADPEYSDWLPTKHDHKDLYYFQKESGEGNGVGYFNSNTDPEKLFSHLKKNGNVYFCEFLYEGPGFDKWFNSALQNVANHVGEISISYVPLGNEYLLTITAKAAVHELQKIPAKVPTCIADGNKEHYQCRKCGKLFSDDKAITTLSGASCVVISKLGHTDGDGDGKCGVCGDKLSSSTVTTTPTTPGTSTEPTTPSMDATEATEPSEDPTESTAPTEGTTGDTTEPTAPKEEATTPSEPETATDPTEETDPGAAEEPEETAPQTPTEPEHEQKQLLELETFIFPACAIAAAVVLIIVSAVRKRRRS